MAQYEIRLSRSTAGLLVFVADHFTDFDAVRNARALAHPGDGIEVWSGDTCIFHNAEAHTPSARPDEKPESLQGRVCL